MTKDYYQNKRKIYGNSIRNTWKVIKEVVGKKKRRNNSFPPQKKLFNKGKEIALSLLLIILMNILST